MILDKLFRRGKETTGAAPKASSETAAFTPDYFDPARCKQLGESWGRAGIQIDGITQL